MKKQRKLSSSDWLLLSAYLDDQLSEAEKRQMDERLQSDPALREMLDSLQRTSVMLRSLPVRRVPRNFTVSAQSVPKKTIPSFINILQFSSAAAAILLVAVFTLELNQTPAQMPASKATEDLQPAVAMETAKMSAAAADEAEGPMIIFWGAPAPIIGAYGKGGGGGGGAEGPGIGGGGAADSLGIGGGGASEEAIPEAAPLVEGVPEFQPTPYAEMPAPEVFESQLTENDLQEQERIAPEPLTGSGPILGVRPPEETTVEYVDETPLRQAPAQTAIPFRLIEIVLAALMILTAIPAWLLKRK